MTGRDGLPEGAQFVTWPRWASAALVIWIVGSSFGGTWWVATYAAETDARIEKLERDYRERDGVNERLARLEERLASITVMLKRLTED